MTMRSFYLVLFSLYWAQGLPVGFMTHALPVLLRSQGLSLSQIGGFGLLLAPWAIKILWAPWVDRYGSYRQWIMVTQILTVAILIMITFLPIQSQHTVLGLFVALFVLNMVGATQDIATDGLAVFKLKRQQQHWGNTFQVLGSRLGFIVGGGFVLWAMDVLAWKWTFLLLAALVFLNTLPCYFYKTSTLIEHSHKPSISLKTYILYFISNHEMKAWFLVLLSFKVVDGLMGTLQKAIMVDLGLSLTNIGIYITMLGAIAAIIGASLAGLVLKKLKRTVSLFIFSVIKLIGIYGFLYLAYQLSYHQVVNPYLIYSINAFEDFSSAMLLVVFLTVVMQYCRQAFSATDFTFQVSVISVVSGGLYILSGIFADFFGYVFYISLILGLGVIHLAIIIYWIKNQKFTKNTNAIHINSAWKK